VNDTIVVCNVRLYEREDASHLPFILRMALLDEALAGSAPENVHMRLHFRLKETRKLIQKKVSNFPICGLAMAAINSKLTSLVPAGFLGSAKGRRRRWSASMSASLVRSSSERSSGRRG
jgi:hypothetical protein